MAEIKIKLETPVAPNYIFHETQPVRRQDGFRESPKTDIADLSDEVLRQIGRDWTEALINNANLRRKDKARG